MAVPAAAVPAAGSAEIERLEQRGRVLDVAGDVATALELLAPVAAAAAAAPGPLVDVARAGLAAGHEEVPRVLLARGLAAAEPTPTGDLGAACRDLPAGDDPFFGQAVVARLEASLEAPPPAAAARLLGALGVERLRLGRNEAAVEALAQARRLARDHGLGAALELQLARDLALAHLRAGEALNCVELHGAASCLLPFAPEAVHARPEHARRAAELYREVLAAEPGDPTARWLLNLAVRAAGDDPARLPAGLALDDRAFAPEADFPAWRDVAPSLGLTRRDLAGGAVADDFDGDGLIDLVASSNDPCRSLVAWRADGRGGYQEVTAAWGLEDQLGGLNLVHADVDGDGRLDLLVLRGGWWGEAGRLRNSLLHNRLGDGGGFVDGTAAAGLAWPAYPTQTAAFADYDGDGDLDLYVGNEAAGAEASPSQLFRNRGDGTFENVTAAAGVANMRFAKGVAWGDFDDDGRPDLYVSNIGPNRLYRNLGDGRFADVAEELGVTAPEGRSFATWFFDFDQDGRLDLFVADYGAAVAAVHAALLGEPAGGGHPLLYRNLGGAFAEVSAAALPDRPLLPMGANWGDVDSDGWPDLYLGTGVPDYAALMPNVLLRNEAGRFREVTYASRLGHLQKGHGVAFADLDHDGDLDLFHQLGGQYPGDAFANALFLNPGTGNRSLTLLLEGRRANRFGVGARVAARLRTATGPRTVHTVAGSGGSFGGSSLRVHLGIGDAAAVEEVVVRWPGSGTVSTYPGVPAGAWRAVEGAARLVPAELPPHPLTAATAPGREHHHPPDRSHHGDRPRDRKEDPR